MVRICCGNFKSNYCGLVFTAGRRFLIHICIHVPEHVFGKFHTIVHHGKNRSFLHYAVLTKNPLVLLDGVLGALPYFVFTPWLWQVSAIGTLLGLTFGEFHVIWRHVSIINWKTPKPVERICLFLFITTPERHWKHHQNAFAAFGDIFTFFDMPAQKWLTFLRYIRRRHQRNKQILSIDQPQDAV